MSRPPTTLRLISDADLKLQSKQPFAAQPWTLRGRVGLNERCGSGGLLVSHMTGLVKEPSLNNGLGSLVRQVTVTATGQSAVVSWSIAQHRDSRLAETPGCHHPQPPPQAEGAGILGTGDRGWRPGGLTSGYCLKPFQGFDDGLGKRRGSPELMTSSEVMEGLDRGWDVSSQKVLGCEGGARRRDVAAPRGWT